MKPFKSKQRGFSLIEVVIALGFLTVIAGGVMLKVDSIQNHIRTSERLLALDSLERSLMQMVSDRQTILYSADQSSQTALKNCLLSDNALCQDGAAYRLPLYLPGQETPFTGAQVFYDYQGNRCQGDCPGFRVITFITVQCASGNQCAQPAHSTVRYDIFHHDQGKNQKVRRDFVDVRRYANGKFPGLSISCPSEQQILRGIGINGRPLCVNLSEVELYDEEGKKLSGKIDVKPVDCSSTATGPDDQNVIVGISPGGELQCAERFW
jgi:prepilin-type N-terminal cleavage/methylation domain-containing protein